jgi:DNA repair exonuclease SbcCD nuclease subunit
MTVKFICYSDVHHGEYHNGLTEEDVLALEDELLEHARARKVDFVLFGGDRFVSRNPPSHTRAAADEKMKRLVQEFDVFAIVGNHCRELKNAHSGHSMMHLRTLLEGEKPYIASEAGVYTPLRRHEWMGGLNDVEFHVIPAGQRGTWQPQKRQTRRTFCILMFHDIVRGSLMSNMQPAEHGLDRDVLDHAHYNIVLGGDNHVHQDLKLTNTKGYYIGSPCQQNWGDAEQPRGFFYVELHDDGRVVTELIISRAPRFIARDLDITENDSATTVAKQLPIDGDDYTGQIIKITLHGTLKACSRIDVGKVGDIVTQRTGARRITVITDPTIVYYASIPALTKIQSVEEDWKAFITSGKLDLQGMDPTQIEALGLEILQEARENHGGRNL